MPLFYSVSGLARHFGAPPRKVSDNFDARRLSDEKCPVADGRRIRPADYLPIVEAALRESGVLAVATVTIRTRPTASHSPPRRTTPCTSNFGKSTTSSATTLHIFRRRDPHTGCGRRLTTGVPPTANSLSGFCKAETCSVHPFWKDYLETQRIRRAPGARARANSPTGVLPS